MACLTNTKSATVALLPQSAPHFLTDTSLAYTQKANAKTLDLHILQSLRANL
jgi:hypothetical protein